MWPPMWRICHNLSAFIVLAGCLSSCAGFPQYSHSAADYYSAAPAESPFLSWQPHSTTTGQEAQLSLLADGLEAFLARLVLIRNARQSLDLQYYLYHDDLTGRVLTLALLQAADRGVRVRLLLDDMSSRGKDGPLAVLAAHPNIAVRLFNPFRREYSRELQFISRYGVSTRRMHNKTLIADNLMALVGGRNIGEEYFNAARDDVIFGDLDVLFSGPVVSDSSALFDRYWNSLLTFPVQQLNQSAVRPQQLDALRSDLQSWVQQQQQHRYIQALKQRLERLTHEVGRRMYSGRVFVLADTPDKLLQPGSGSPLLTGVRQLSDQSRESILLVSPYFVPGEAGVAYLKQLVQRGLQVTVLTNSLAATDVPAVHSAYKHYRRELLQAGVALWELKPDSRVGRISHWSGSSSASLHAKMLIADQRYLFVGSMNFDPRSVVHNTETGLLIDQPRLAAHAYQTLLAELPQQAYRLSWQQDQLLWQEAGEDGRSRWYRRDPKAGVWRRLQSWLLGWLPLESEL